MTVNRNLPLTVSDAVNVALEILAMGYQSVTARPLSHQEKTKHLKSGVISPFSSRLVLFVWRL